MNITLNIDDFSVGNRLSSFSVTEKISYKKVITTLDGVDHPYPGIIKPVVTFSLLPGTGEEDSELYKRLKRLILTVTYTDKDREVTRKMRVISDLESVFLLTSFDGKRRYKTGAIQLRGL